MNNTNTNDNNELNATIANVQAELLDMPVGMTRAVSGVTITRWSDEVFEVGTWGRAENNMGSEHAALEICGCGWQR